MFEMLQTGKEELPNWRATTRHNIVAEILLSEQALVGWNPLEAELTGVDLRVALLDPAQEVPDDIEASSHILIIEVRRDSNATLERLARLLRSRPAGTVIAAMRDPSIDDVRGLLRAGAADILSLPLQPHELEAALGRIRADIEAGISQRGPSGRVVSVIKSVGGVGATCLLTQIAAIHAEQESKQGRETCLIDLDIQFGSAALYLGALPGLGLQDLIGAGNRVDSALLRSTTVQHASGLNYIAAPAELLPLEAVDQDQIATILELAASEYATVFVDLPPSWTNWSLSALARSDLVLLVTDLSVAGLHQARRQLEFIAQQGLAELPVRIVANRVEKKLFKSIDLQDAARVLGREPDFAITEDTANVSSALDQGVAIAEIDARSRAARDIRKLADAVANIFAGAA